MTVIKSVIPHELKGTASVSTKITGLNAEFLIPRKYIELGTGPTSTQHVTHGEKSQAVSTANSEKILTSAFIVEDNLLISLDLKKHLKRLGIDKIDIFGDISSARAALAKSKPSMMFLDVHLGNENTFQLGIEIQKLSIPFLFITGYGAAIELPEELSDVDILTKPVDTTLLKRSIEAFGFKV